MPSSRSGLGLAATGIVISQQPYYFWSHSWEIQTNCKNDRKTDIQHNETCVCLGKGQNFEYRFSGKKVITNGEP